MTSAPTVTPAVVANSVYHYPNPPVALRIGTGGSGQSGLLQAMAEEFIKCSTQKDQCSSFAIEWYTSDTSASIDYLGKKMVDIGITYHAVAEYTALEKGIVDRVEYVWRDHWMLVGPKTNPAKLPTDGSSTVYSLLTKLFSAMEDSKDSGRIIKFLSRYDSSACNITESTLWGTIGQTPWAPPISPWYHMLTDFPIQAIRKAADLGEYTLTDRGTWCAIESTVREKLTVFAQGEDDENDPLLNPAHLLVGTHAENKDMANRFADWMVRPDGGQKVIKEFQRNGYDLYTTAPEIDPLDRVKRILQPEPQSHKAVVQLTRRPNEMFFFKDDRYARIDAVKDELKWSFPIGGYWKSLATAECVPVDATLPNPKEKHQTYFFSGSKCAIIDMTDDVFHGTFKTADGWKTLGPCGFGSIDAALPWMFRGDANAAVFFYGYRCICIDLARDQLYFEATDITTRFSALKEARFTTIDTAVLKPGTNNTKAYFFSGEQYALVSLDTDHLDYGPVTVKDTWKSLHKAGFY